ncbi:MAG TPA: MarR family transcriptional regulator [Gemmatimonadaceae bacterium]|nr:MarR family transcriptional regulator [Gemmatimonadaceae bacterium]
MSTASLTRRSAAQQRALKLFVVLQRCASAVSGNVEANANIGDLSETEFGILEALYHKGPLLLGDVQKKILLSSGGVTYAIDRLAEKGLVERRECASDRRARYAALTARGSALMDDVFPSHASAIEQVMATLTAREQDQAIALLRKLGLGAASN